MNGKVSLNYLNPKSVSRLSSYARQDIDEHDIDAVVKVLKSDFITQGPVLPLFEKKFRDAVSSKHAVAFNSATSALHAACLALGVTEGDTVWTVPNSFVASANCALYCGATVDFVDIDPLTRNMSIEHLSEKLRASQKRNDVPKVIIPVHFAGFPADMAAIHELSKLYGFKVLEDASHATGSVYKSSKIGSCKYSDITVFSFHPVKIVTTAEGGVATTNCNDLKTSLSLFRAHGVTRDQARMRSFDPEPWFYEQHALGYNYKMTEMAAALGVNQLDKLQVFVNKRNVLAKTYDDLLRDDAVTLPPQSSDAYSSYHLYVIELPPLLDRRNIFIEMTKQNIGVNVHYIPIHIQPYFADLGFKRGDFPMSEAYYANCLTLPLHTGLKRRDLTLVVDVLRHAMNK